MQNGLDRVLGEAVKDDDQSNTSETRWHIWIRQNLELAIDSKAFASMRSTSSMLSSKSRVWNETSSDPFAPKQHL